MKKIVLLFLQIVFATVLYSQDNNLINARAVAKMQQMNNVSVSRNSIAASVNSLPEQDCISPITVCQNSYSVANSYVGAGSIVDIAFNSNTCIFSGEKNSSWYSFTCYTPGRLKFTITPNDLTDDYDFVLFDMTGHTCDDIKNNLVPADRCNFSATGGKTGLDSSGTRYSEDAPGSVYNPLEILTVGHTYLLNISNWTGSPNGYKLNFTGTTADIFGGVNSQIQSVVSNCGTDSLVVNLTYMVLNSSIAGNGSDFLLSGPGGSYAITNAYGTGATKSNKIIVKLGTPIAGGGTYSLSLQNGSDGNTVLNICSNSPSSASTFTFTNGYVFAPTTVCQNQTFTISTTAAISYTWSGELVPPADANNQSLAITSTTTGNFTFTLQADDNCMGVTKVFSVTVNPTPSAVITSTAPVSCPGTTISLVGAGATNYLWSVINPSYENVVSNNYTSSVFNATPKQENVYKLTGSNSYGCSSTAFYTLAVLPSPIINILGPDTVCSSSPAVLTYTGTADSYTWSTGAVNINTISVTPITQYNVFVNGTFNSNGCATKVYKTVYGKDRAVITATTGFICSGDSLLLTSSPLDNYSWSTGANTQTIVVKPTSPTTYSIIGSDLACGTRTASYYVNVLALPNVSISLSPTICTSSSSVYGFNASTTYGLLSYTWSNGSNTYNTSGYNIPYPYPGYTNTLSVTAIGSGGCKNTSSITYSVYPTPTVSAIVSNEVCAANQYTLTGLGASVYTWSPMNTISPTIAVSPTVTTNYWVRGISEFGCTSSTYGFSVNVSASNSLSVAATKSIICVGSSNTLTATGNGIYSWYTSDTATVPVNVGLSKYDTPVNLTVGTYTYYVSSNCNGNVKIPVAFEVKPKPTIAITTASTVVCPGTTFQLVASGATTYTWSYGYMNDTLNTNTAGNYLVFGSDIYGCVNSNSISISSYPAPSISPNSFSICKGTPRTFSVTGAASYTWNPGAISTPITITPTTAATYTANTLSPYGCQLGLVMYISILPTPTVNTGFSGNSLCVGNTVTLTASGASTYTWSNGVANASVAVTPTMSQTYSVVGTATNGCTSSSSKSISPLPVLGFMAPVNDTVCYGASPSFSATGASSYSWYLGFSTSGAGNFMAYTTSLYAPKTFTLTGTTGYTQGNSYSCTSSLVKTIQVRPSMTVTPVANPTIVCQGGSSTLSVTGASTYTWTGGIVSNTLSAVPSSSVTIYNVTGKDIHGCTDTKTVAVNVKFMPYPYMVNTMNGSYQICMGGVAYLNSTNSADSYTWQPGGMNTPSIAVSPTTATTYTLASTSTVCSVTRTTSVMVYPLPNASIVSNGDLTCTNTTRKLTLQSSYSGNPYSWSGPGIISPINSSTISINQPGVYTGTITAWMGGTNAWCSNTASIIVNSYTNAPTISLSSPSPTICGGQSYTFTPNGANTYTYSSGSNVVTPSVTTNYTISGTNTGGCIGTTTVDVAVNSTQLPTVTIAAPNIACYNTPMTVSANGADTYTWSNGSTAQSFTMIPGYPSTNLSVIGKDVNSCTDTATLNVNTDLVQTAGGGNAYVCQGGTGCYGFYATAHYQWSTGDTTATVCVSPSIPTTYTVVITNTNNCTAQQTVFMDVKPTPTISVNSGTICQGESFTLTPSGANTYYYYSGSNVVTPYTTSIYSVQGTDANWCTGTGTTQIVVNPNPVISLSPDASICEGSSVTLIANGATTYSWSNGAVTDTITDMPLATSYYTVTGYDSNNCHSYDIVGVYVDNTCQDVWPGDANSDGVADNLDVLELGLHYTQTGASRASIDNTWQSQRADNWTGTISNGKNLNHSDCNGDGVIGDDDTLAIYNNYGSAHAFKLNNTNNNTQPNITIVPDQSAVAKGACGTASIYLGNDSTTINNLNGVAFTVIFDNTLIELNNIWIEYLPSFINANSDNLHFRKTDFSNNALYTATTHTLNNNVSGYGKIAILHYQINSGLTTDAVLNLGLLSANQSDSNGFISPLTPGTGTVMVVGSTVGIHEVRNGNYIAISPNPATSQVIISADFEFEKIELTALTGQILLTETVNAKSYLLNLQDVANGVYFVKTYSKNKQTSIKKLVVQK